MITRKKKTCNICETEQYIFSKGRCQSCSQKSYAKNAVRSKRKRIKVVSDKKLEDLKLYRENRDEYMFKHPVCEVDECENPSTDLHHKAGRSGSLLWNPKYFLATCHHCHFIRIHENPKWAREKGYILTVNLK